MPARSIPPIGLLAENLLHQGDELVANYIETFYNVRRRHSSLKK